MSSKQCNKMQNLDVDILSKEVEIERLQEENKNLKLQLAILEERRRQRLLQEEKENSKN